MRTPWPVRGTPPARSVLPHRDARSPRGAAMRSRTLAVGEVLFEEGETAVASRRGRGQGRSARAGAGEQVLHTKVRATLGEAALRPAGIHRRPPSRSRPHASCAARADSCPLPPPPGRGPPMLEARTGRGRPSRGSSPISRSPVSERLATNRRRRGSSDSPGASGDRAHPHAARGQVGTVRELVSRALARRGSARSARARFMAASYPRSALLEMLALGD